MYWQCPECEQIYHNKYMAQECCPVNPTPIDDSAVVCCWRCREDGCEACWDQGIMPVRLVRCRDELAMATIRKYAASS